MLEIILYLLTEIVLLFNILTFVHITQTRITRKFSLKLVFYFVLYIVISLLFYIFYSYSEDIFFAICLFLLCYIRFPLIISDLTNITFLKGIFITVIVSQSCDLIQLLIYNIIEIPNLISKYCISLIIKLSALLFLILLTKKANLNKIKSVIRYLPKYIYILIAINILLMGAITSITGYDLSIESNIIKRVSLTNIILLLIFIISVIITFSLISNCISKTYYNSVNSILEKQIENQIEHYNQTERLNSDLRRFKHDYTNHMLCLKAMIGSNQNSEALEYIEKINSEIFSQSKAYNTGHKIADAIFNEKHRIHSDISIKFDGCIPDFIDNVDLCIALGNAVDNAIEACEKLSGTDKIVDISANYQQSHFILIIKNPVSEDYAINGSFPETTKADPLKHGFGLSNIKRIADKYDGDMSVEVNDCIFTLYLALKVN